MRLCMTGAVSLSGVHRQAWWHGDSQRERADQCVDGGIPRRPEWCPGVCGLWRRDVSCAPRRFPERNGACVRRERAVVLERQGE